MFCSVAVLVLRRLGLRCPEVGLALLRFRVRSRWRTVLSIARVLAVEVPGGWFEVPRGRSSLSNLRSRCGCGEKANID